MKHYITIGTSQHGELYTMLSPSFTTTNKAAKVAQKLVAKMGSHVRYTITNTKNI